MGYFASTDGSDDITPVADETDPATLGTATATLSGTVTDEDGAALTGAHVGIAGQDTGGLGPVLADDTDADRPLRDHGLRGHPSARDRVQARVRRDPAPERDLHLDPQR